MLNAHYSQLKSKETPYYFYDLKLLSDTLQQLCSISQPLDYQVHYAMKANANAEILRLIKGFGLGVDCVSGNEVQKALELGFAPEQIVFAGVGKTDHEIVAALKAGIFCLNCESIEELEVIQELAQQLGVQSPVALRVNPAVDARTHQYITTGKEENKFGINSEDLHKVWDHLHTEYTHILFKGLHFHVGSQIVDLSVFRSLCERINAIQADCIARGLHFDILNVGGGLGVNYETPDQQLIPDFEGYFQVFKEGIELMEGQQLHFELGRSIVAQCGSLISKVLYVKKGERQNFAILDAGMTDLLRPALYQSEHKIENISKEALANDFPTDSYDVVGPICESSDCFGKGVKLPLTQRHDLVAIRSAGAYGQVMASSYNLRDTAKAYYAH
jgi:diaminopimelate decarboxylase